MPRRSIPGQHHPTTAIVLLWCALAAAPAPALAQTLATPGLTPTFAPAPNLPGGMVALDGAPAPSYTAYPGVHGYVSTGVSTGNGRGIEGAVIVPILPGTVTLEAGGGTGQQPVFLPGARKSTATASVSTYHAALHIRPTDDLQIDIAIAGANLHGPGIAAFPPPGPPHLP